MSRSQLPSSVDLSTSIYFPPIGDQGQYGSCVAWASTYYQFTYEMNKLNGIPTTRDNSYSPSWTWNYLNEGQNIGTWYGDAYKVLKYFGAEKFSEMPYDANNYDFSWSTDVDDMRNALSSRVSNTSSFNISGNGTTITSPTDTDLNAVKSKLNDGHVLTVMTNSWSSSYNDRVIFRGDSSSSSWHALTIVGYNDNFTYDFNQNNIIETSERGAFKVANSWGTSSGENGYCWIMYDALNGVSANTTNNWESNYSTTRKAIFNVNPSPENNNVNNQNIFFYITVENRDVNYVGELNIDTNYRNKINLSIQHRGTYSADNYTQIYPIRTRGYKNYYEPFSGTLLLDYGNCYNEDNPYQYYNNNDWYIQFGEDGNTYVDYFVTSWINQSVAHYKITDSKGETIKQFGNISIPSGYLKYSTSRKIQSVLGDLNYNNTIDIADLATIQQILSSNLIPSNVQKRLADCDSDGDIDNSDKQYILNNLS
ncbi:MAG: hypothetical protein IJP18_08135 [Oscillospiraceae bacterium]|nr:hypothetical protein [Oscillospiraceae bacterium]